MGPYEAFEIVVRYSVAAGMGYLVNHGVSQIYNDQTFIQAITWIVIAAVLWALSLARALWRSRFAAKAKDVADTGKVAAVVMKTDADANAIQSDKVVSAQGIAPIDPVVANALAVNSIGTR